MISKLSRLLVAAGTATALLAAPMLVVSPASAAASPVLASGAHEEGVIPGAWIVTVRDGEGPRAVAADHQRQHGANVAHVYEHALRGYAARMSDDAAGRVGRDHRVLSVQPDRVIRKTSETVPTGVARINAAPLDSATATAGIDVDVAVIDTGIAPHPDLDIAGGVDCSGTRDESGGTHDGDGHGTHVAGTVAALNTGEGLLGVAPGARLHAVKVLSDDGSGTWSDVICGVDWVTAQNAAGVEIEVANMSLGGRGQEPSGSGCSTGDALHDAICKSVAAGTTYTVAAGNSGRDAKGSVPAAYDEVITVSALADSDGAAGGGTWAAACRTGETEDALASFSNYGLDVDIAAPGVCILSTWLAGGQSTISGTSMASPHVAGAAALVAASNPGWSPAQVKQSLLAAGNAGWTDTSPDGVQEPLLDVTTLLSGADPIEEPAEEPVSTAIKLGGEAYKVKGVKTVNLTWDQKEAGTSVITRRHGTTITTFTTEDDGAYTDNISGKGGGSYEYQVCDADEPATCSNIWIATF